MDIYFSTFDIIKGLGLKRSTFQSSLDAGYIVADKGKATKKGERSKFSLEAFYNINLYFHLLRAGIPRPEAAKWSKDIDWENIGPKPGQYKYFTIKLDTMPESRRLIEIGSESLTKKPPPTLNDGKTMMTVINLAQLKQQVDRVVEGMK